MINEKLQNAFNDQINKELYSEYLYLAMKTYFMEQNLMGFVNWFDVQVQEEHAHAMGMFNYLNERGGQIELMSIDKPVYEGKTPLEIFEEVEFLAWYIAEQVEEEASVDGVLTTLKLIGDDKKALLLLDKDLATRTFVAPVIG